LPVNPLAATPPNRGRHLEIISRDDFEKLTGKLRFVAAPCIDILCDRYGSLMPGEGPPVSHFVAD
jgi:hypothetical protein